MSTVNLMPTSHLFGVNNQKGAVPFLIPIIIGIIIIGGIILITSNSKKASKTENTRPAPQTTTDTSTSSANQAAPLVWKTYKDEERGYSIKHPEGWTVENLPAEDRQLIRVSDDAKSAFVLIEAFAGSSLEKEGELERVLDSLEDKFKQNTNLKITNFSKVEPKDGVGGYNAAGEETYGEKTVLFEEKMMVGKTGRSLRVHAAYHPDSKEINRPITTAIIKSFSTD